MSCDQYKSKRDEAINTIDQKYKKVEGDVQAAGTGQVYLPAHLPPDQRTAVLNAANKVNTAQPECDGGLGPSDAQPLPTGQKINCDDARSALVEFDNGNLKTAGLAGASSDITNLYQDQTCRAGQDNVSLKKLTMTAAIQDLNAHQNLAQINVALVTSAQRKLLADRCTTICNAEAQRPGESCDADSASSDHMEASEAKSAASKCSGVAAEEKKAAEATASTANKNSSNGNNAAMGQAMSALAGLLQALLAQQQQATASATPSPATDCSTAAAAQNNILCICQLNPKSSMCQAAEQFPSGLSTSSGPVGPSAPTTSASTASDGAVVGGFEGKPTRASGSATADGGGGAGLGGGGRGLQNIAGGGDNPGGPSGVPTGVIQGTSGGAGTGGTASGGGGGTQNGGGRNNNNGNGTGSLNLKPLLPNWQNRSVAGMSISAKDGLTAPLGPSLFEKISRQYQNQSQKRNLIDEH